MNPDDERAILMPHEEDPLVVFMPSGKRGHFAKGTPLLQAARQLGVDIDSICGGRGLCGRCQVQPVHGDFAKLGVRSAPDHLSPFSEPEQAFSRRCELPEGNRLSCHARIQDDLVIDVPASSQVHRQVIRKDHAHRDLSVDPLTHLHYVAVRPPSLEHPKGDLERLLDALDEHWQLPDLRCAPHVLAGLQTALRRGAWNVTVAVRQKCEVVAVWPGFRDRALGIAVDVGSTTLAAHCCDLVSGELLGSAGAMNPQIRFGEDLMSRVSYAMLHEDGAAQMTRAVREAIDTLLSALLADVAVEPDEIMELTFVGNPVMHHLLLGISPSELGTAPFSLATGRGVQIPAPALDLSLHPGARAYVLPCIAGHVGADAAGMLLAESPSLDEGVTLLVDVGTNAEMILSGRGRLLAASSPTGPAFEGAQISCGQRAAPGAIERVRIDPETLEPRFKIIGCEAWSDAPEFELESAKTGVTGLCGTGIIEAVAELFLASVIDPDGRIDPARAARNRRLVMEGRTCTYVLHDGPPAVRVTQSDVRAIQLAKAALYAGARLLMDHLGVARVDRIRLAGAFGSHIDVKYAMVLGMVPDCALAAASSAGNAAGTGAIAALLDGRAREQIEAEVRRVEKVETAVEPRFQQHFVAAMALPHATDPYPELARLVPLPRRNPSERSRRRRDHRGRGGAR